MSFLGPNELARVANLLPRFVSKLTQLMDNFEKRTGKKTAVVSGHRDNAKQAAIYADSLAQGFRAAPPGKSKHQFAAVDLHVVGETVGDAAKDRQNRYYAILAEEARRVGLKSGYDFKPRYDGDYDPYHIEDPAPIDVLAREHAEFVRGRLWRAAVVVALVAFAAAVVMYLRRRRSKHHGGA